MVVSWARAILSISKKAWTFPARPYHYKLSFPKVNRKPNNSNTEGRKGHAGLLGRPRGEICLAGSSLVPAAPNTTQYQNRAEMEPEVTTTSPRACFEAWCSNWWRRACPLWGRDEPQSGCTGPDLQLLSYPWPTARSTATWLVLLSAWMHVTQHLSSHLTRRRIWRQPAFFRLSRLAPI